MKSASLSRAISRLISSDQKRTWRGGVAPRQTPARACAAALLVAGIPLALNAHAENISIVDFNPSIPLGPLPCEIHFTAPDTAWIEELGANQIGEWHPSTNIIVNTPVPGPAGAGGIALGADGGIWFGEMAENNIDRLDPITHQIQQFAIPVPPAGALTAALDQVQGLLGSTHLPTGVGLAIALSEGPDNAVWFVETGNNAIGRIDLVSHVVTSYAIPTPLAAPLIIHQGPGTTLVFDEAAAGKIGTIDAYTHQFKEYTLSTPASVPQGVTTGPDGNIWFSETGGQKVGTVDMITGLVSEYSIATLTNLFLPRPGSIVFGPDGNLYVAEGNLDGSSNMGQFNPVTHHYTDYLIPTPLGSVCDLNKDSVVGNKIYFTEWIGTKIGVLTVSP